ncbi:YtxH domain-containing protein [Lentilactobacillus sp. Marseille-Q4993]|uniref:YtxH domain-containing protein n=1 Tax=Lentilactobacillus sp. Marseille-Q4993 TaxID=3039492 RepID=UPI0024BD2381|nr:YtxH domain-containing protein [Lentilactobacillus sp. Marseille-Q4993]
MGKKIAGGLFASLLGAGLYAAYQKLDQDKKDKLKADLKGTASDLKDRAVDYAFYAEDAINDAKEVISDSIKQSNVSNVIRPNKDAKKAQKVDDDTDTAEEVDIVVDAEDAIGSEGQEVKDTDTVIFYPGKPNPVKAF